MKTTSKTEDRSIRSRYSCQKTLIATPCCMSVHNKLQWNSFSSEITTISKCAQTRRNAGWPRSRLMPRVVRHKTRTITVRAISAPGKLPTVTENTHPRAAPQSAQLHVEFSYRSPGEDMREIAWNPGISPHEHRIESGIIFHHTAFSKIHLTYLR